MSRHYTYLDLARGLAALAVFVGHLRGFVFVDFQLAGGMGPLWKIFYFVTGLGHSAVILFFVLSGFLIGRNVARSLRSGQWSWLDYAIKRMTRLWLVLLPALVLTAVLDQCGQHLIPNPIFYSGALYDTFHSGPMPDATVIAYDFKTFVLNALFLQMIAAPTFGTNGPLWSLANEFWYYAFFPLLLLTVARNSKAIHRIAYVAIAVVLCWLLPFWLLRAGMVWLFGYFAWEVSERVRFPNRLTRTVTVAAMFSVFVAVLAWARLGGGGDYNDFMIGAAFAFLLIGMTHAEIQNKWLLGLSTSLAAMSYTLYLVHFPAAAFLTTLLLRGQRFAPSIAACVIYAALIAAILFYAWLVYLAFERHTARVQRQLLALVAFRRNFTTTTQLL
jgi:peptidoglycan/LPS O-acetylase OafA/YrhL